MLTEKQVLQKCEEFAQKWWGLKFNVPISINKRLTRVLGRYEHTRDNKPLLLTIAYATLKDYKPETIDSVILHELTHWALGISGKPSTDGHPIFERELKRVGASTTQTIKHAGDLHKIVCCGCKKTIALTTKIRANNLMKKANRCTTKCCSTRYEYVGVERVMDNFTLQQ